MGHSCEHTPHSHRQLSRELSWRHLTLVPLGLDVYEVSTLFTVLDEGVNGALGQSLDQVDVRASVAGDEGARLLALRLREAWGGREVRDRHKPGASDGCRPVAQLVKWLGLR